MTVQTDASHGPDGLFDRAMETRPASSLAPGRYCLATCYCGECPHYEPIKRPTAAPTEQPRISKTWTEREVETWIDAM